MKEGGKFLFLDPSNTTSPSDMAPPPADAAEIDPTAKEALAELVTILLDNGLNPVTQLSGYLIAEDPTYLPEGTNARMLARKVGRDKLLETLIELYLEDHPCATSPFHGV